MDEISRILAIGGVLLLLVGLCGALLRDSPGEISNEDLDADDDLDETNFRELEEHDSSPGGDDSGSV